MILFGDSKIIVVPSNFRRLSDKDSASLLILGKNPINWKWSVGKPLATRELITEVAPGNGMIFILKLIKSFISLNPGSEINGVPASDIIPPEDSFFSKLIIFFLSLSEDLSLYVMIF